MVHFNDKSLMAKFKLNIEELDYKYIENCNDIKKLEKILQVLRSGEEGEFPDLTSFCEKTLKKRDPSNRLLLKEKKIIQYAELQENERKEIQRDLQAWSDDLSYNEEERRTKKMSYIELDIPSIRNQKMMNTHQKPKPETQVVEKKLKNMKPRSYEEWDKLNVEEELVKLEDEDSTIHKEQVEKNIELSDTISIAGLTKREREHIAELENIKGNEAFKAKQYKEAIVYYTRSLSAYKMIKTLNNRAQTLIKLKNYVAAVIDCNEIITQEPDNLKAFYGRGIAHKEAGMTELAVIDFHIVLEIDPHCQSAKDQLKQIKSSKLEDKKEKKKILIEEIETDDVSEKNTISLEESESVKKIIIEEVSDKTPNTKRLLLDEMCHFSEDQSGVQPLSVKTKQMLLVTQKDDSSKKFDHSNGPVECPGQVSKNSNPKKVLVEFEDDAEEMSPNLNDNLNSKLIDIKIRNENESERKSPKYNHVKNQQGNNAEKRKHFTQKSHLNNTVEMTRTAYFHNKDNILCNAEERLEENKNLLEMAESPYEFLNAWKSNDANFNSKIGADILLSVKPYELPQILTNKLDAELLSGMCRAISYIVSCGKFYESMQYLCYLMKTPRISFLSMVLSKQEKENIKHLISTLEEKYKGEMEEVKRSLKI